MPHHRCLPLICECAVKRKLVHLGVLHAPVLVGYLLLLFLYLRGQLVAKRRVHGQVKRIVYLVLDEVKGLLALEPLLSPAGNVHRVDFTHPLLGRSVKVRRKNLVVYLPLRVIVVVCSECHVHAVLGNEQVLRRSHEHHFPALLLPKIVEVDACENIVAVAAVRVVEVLYVGWRHLPVIAVHAVKRHGIGIRRIVREHCINFPVYHARVAVISLDLDPLDEHRLRLVGNVIHPHEREVLRIILGHRAAHAAHIGGKRARVVERHIHASENHQLAIVNEYVAYRPVYRDFPCLLHLRRRVCVDDFHQAFR